MKTTTSYYKSEIEINKARGIQPSELLEMPYYKFRMYFESVSEELKAKKKSYEEQQRQQQSRKWKMPRLFGRKK
ncbi:hypothetical protein BPT24_131 [Tenacibaculum phage pT24]|uniref:Uncharacterized protein n=1 Tax=Tenacibaculum phage pT24 TaxID=1880590 RepID=A0A1B4XWS3_9CAUD|nr:hypothetical protein HYP10_gp131 [Tenacibaculum phage pT24]BAV39256.1 hypothetical protein BPT24_131 [Tenacibaculum phage pT24]